MKVNGLELPLHGVSLRQVGEMLVDASPNKDGVGIYAVFEEKEENTLEANFGMLFLRQLRASICEALRVQGKTPAFKIMYEVGTMTLTTTAS